MQNIELRFMIERSVILSQLNNVLNDVVINLSRLRDALIRN